MTFNFLSELQSHDGSLENFFALGYFQWLHNSSSCDCMTIHLNIPLSNELRLCLFFFTLNKTVISILIKILSKDL